MKAAINFILKYSGAGKVWGFLDGKKAYGTGSLAVLGALLGLATQVAPLLSAHDTIGLYGFFTHLSSDPNWLALLAGFGVIAAAHRSDKNAAKEDGSQVVAPEVTPPPANP